MLLTSCLVGAAVARVVGSTLAVAATWLLVVAVTAGCGWLIRRGVGALAGGVGPQTPACADLWIGLAGLLAYLQLWNLVLGVGAAAWGLPALAGAAGLWAGWRRRSRLVPSRRLAAAAALVGLGWLWVADTALALPGDSDDGLYHLGIIEYAERYPAIRGLGNLGSRLAAGDAHLLLVALLNHGPWSRAGWHLADGLLAAMLFLELGARLAAPGGGGPSFTRRLAFLLAVATVVCIAIRPTHRITSPNLDFAAYVLVVVGMLYLADCVENGFRTGPAAASLASLAAASVTRPLYWLPMLAALAVLALLAAPGLRPWAARARRSGAVVALPAVLALGWMARQAILSGYPLFPLTIGGLPVSWRMPASAVWAATRGDEAWARDPNAPEAAVLASWHWVSAYWWPFVRDDVDVVLPLSLLCCLAPALLAARGRDPGRRRRTPAMLAVVVPSLVVLAVWFLTAPDPRFAFAPLWLIPAALAAWALPPLGRPRAGELAAAGLVGAVLAATIGVGGLGEFVWLLPAECVAWAYAYGLWRLLRRGRGAALARAALLSSLVAAVGVAAARQHGFSLVSADGKGPFGMPLEPTPTVRAVRTSSGLRVWEPVQGGDCYAILDCTPAVPGVSGELHLLGAGIGSGFSVEAGVVSAHSGPRGASAEAGGRRASGRLVASSG